MVAVVAVRFLLDRPAVQTLADQAGPEMLPVVAGRVLIAQRQVLHRKTDPVLAHSWTFRIVACRAAAAAAAQSIHSYGTVPMAALAAAEEAVEPVLNFLGSAELVAAAEAHLPLLVAVKADSAAAVADVKTEPLARVAMVVAAAAGARAGPVAPGLLFSTGQRVIK